MADKLGAMNAMMWFTIVHAVTLIVCTEKNAQFIDMKL